MIFVNLTAHNIDIVAEDGTAILTLKPMNRQIRCSEEVRPTGSVRVNDHRVPLVERAFGDLSELPPPEIGTLYISSYLAARAAW